MSVYYCRACRADTLIAPIAIGEHVYLCSSCAEKVITEQCRDLERFAEYCETESVCKCRSHDRGEPCPWAEWLPQAIEKYRKREDQT